MPPLNSVPSSDEDNEATAELPVLDVAAYEATLRGEEPTDTWVLPTSTFTPAATSALEATAEMPASRLDGIPTLTKAVPAYDLDHSGTHEMPASMLGAIAKPAKPAKKTAAKARPAAVTVSAAAATPAAAPPPAASSPLIDDLRTALANADRRITELQERARIADAERAAAIARANVECAQLREQLGAQRETLSTSRQRLGVQRTDQAEITDAYHERGHRITVLERQLAEQNGVLEAVRAQLATSEQSREILECDRMNLRATVARRNEHIAMLEADLAARQQREQSLKQSLAEAVAAVRPDLPQLQAEILVREEKLRELRAELQLARAQVSEKDDDLRVAEESLRQLENDLRDKSGKLQEASVTVEEWRMVIAESQKSILQRDSRIQELETDLQNHRFSSTLDTGGQNGLQTSEEVALEGPARVLIRTDGNTDFVHVLGRRTRIGRGSDNEIVLDTKHISRYHAVLLAGPVNTSIEDLNSTNGVFVNGKRVTRQVLSSGDKVTIGKSQFRYNVRD
jgi:hypothetical protein